VTAYSGDDGVDMILDAPAGKIGVQVKRYSGAIAVSQIRELTGALVVNGLTKGMFVTTSGFQSGAARTAEMSARHGDPIELYDADRFFDALQIAQRTAFDRSRTTLLDRPVALTLVATRTGDAHNKVLG
jgi:restriction system protein